jgi:hypothetical protein
MHTYSFDQLDVIDINSTVKLNGKKRRVDCQLMSVSHYFDN